MRRVIISNIILWAFISSTCSQQLAIGYDKLTSANGLSANDCSALLQDSRGFIWVGTANGLNRYDGRFFKTYNTLGQQGLTDLSIMCLAEDGDGNIWIGTQNGLNELDPFTDKITRYYEGIGPGTIPFKWCNYLFTDKQKKLWLTSEKGIALFNKSNNSFQNFPVTLYRNDSRVNKFIDMIMEDRRGRFWLATSFGIKLFDRENKTSKTYLYEEENAPALASYPITSISEDIEGNIWAGTWGGGLLKLNEEKDVFEKQKVVGDNFKKYIITEIGMLKLHGKEYLGLATNAGFLLYDPFSTQQLIHTSMSDNFRHFRWDRQSNLWLTSVSGMYKMNNNSLALQWISLPAEGSEQEMVFHIIPSVRDESSEFYLSTINGWWRYKVNDPLVTVYPLPPDPKKLLTGINDWYMDNSGYWFTSVKGLGYYNSDLNRLEDLSSLAGDASGTGEIALDKQGKFWITLQRNGILVYSPGTKRSVLLFNDRNLPDNTVGSDINDMKLGPDGNIYFTAVKRLYRVNTSDFSYKIFDTPKNANQIDEGKIAPDKILPAPGGRLFLSSPLEIYELRHESLVKVYPASGYTDFNIDKFWCNGKGIVWVTTSKGIMRTDTSFSRWVNITERLGLSTDEQINEVRINNNGELFFTAKGKIGLLKDSLLEKAGDLPPVVISRIRQGSRENFMASLREVKLRGSYREPVELEIASLNYLNGKENRILYQLNGWDRNWKELLNQPVVRYEQLPPGRYVFTVKQVNAEGAESPPVSVSFRVLPPFYLSWWFITLAVIIIGLTLYSIYRYRLTRALEMEKLRTRIATDLHDDIGATLSSISMYSDAVKQQVKETLPHLEPVMDKIGENSREMVASMSDIVWAINPQNDEGSKLLQRMEDHARDLCTVKNIMLHFQADDPIRSISLPMAYRKNIYLVFKEALNNALKYAGAKNISIELHKAMNKLEMIISDDGKGFFATAESQGNGLRNMRERSKEIDGNTVIESTPGQGTRIIFSCNLTGS